MTGAREAELLEATNLLLNARRTLVPIDDLPARLQPVTMDEVYWVQDNMALAYGSVGGWKVGAGTPEATPMAAPMPAAWMAATGSSLGGHRFRGIECEIAFLLKDDLPQRAQAYSDEEVYAAVGGCHPAIEIIESGLTDPTVAPRMSMLADLQMHGGFIYGAAVPNWQQIDFQQEHVTLTIDGTVRVERTGSNTAGDLRRLLPWLANEGAARTGGLRAGQWITTGSWTGCVPALADSRADAEFSTAGRVTLRFI